jgi:hypothetical protein
MGHSGAREKQVNSAVNQGRRWKGDDEDGRYLIAFAVIGQLLGKGEAR